MTPTTSNCRGRNVKSTRKFWVCCKEFEFLTYQINLRNQLNSPPQPSIFRFKWKMEDQKSAAK
ncbi:hypothetical protein ACS0TY_002696 [Phlomoides rotata]